MPKIARIPPRLTDDQRELVARNIGLAGYAVRRFQKAYTGPHIPFPDLLSEASYALCLLVPKWNPARGSLSTLACRAIVAELRHFAYRSRHTRDWQRLASLSAVEGDKIVHRPLAALRRPLPPDSADAKARKLRARFLATDLGRQHLLDLDALGTIGN